MSRGTRAARRTELAADRRPVRSCVACRTRRPQVELVRVTLSDTATDRPMLVATATRGASPSPGRGAYLCHSAACVARALEHDALLLRRALRTRATVTVSEELERVGSPTS